jgi:hypothetical protein
LYRPSADVRQATPDSVSSAQQIVAAAGFIDKEFDGRHVGRSGYLTVQTQNGTEAAEFACAATSSAAAALNRLDRFPEICPRGWPVR